MSKWGWLAQPVHSGTAVAGKAWRDNAWLAYWDRSADAFGILHFSTSPAGGGRRARCSVVVGGERAEVIEALEPGTFSSPSIRFDLEGRAVVDAPGLQLDIEAVPRFVVGDFSASGVIPTLEGASDPLRHYQQGAAVSGRLVLRDRDVTIDGLGFRDRTWGSRDESVQFVEWLGVEACLPDFDLTLIKFRDSTGAVSAHGFLLSDDGAAVVTAIDVTREAGGRVDGMSLRTDDGRTLRFGLRRARGAFWLPLGAGGPPPSTVAFDESVDLELDGVVVGSGLAEQGAVHVL